MRTFTILACLALTPGAAFATWPADTSWAPVPGAQLLDSDFDREGGGSFLELTGTAPDPTLWWAIDADTVYLRIHVVENPGAVVNLDNGGWAVTFDVDAIPSVLDHALEASTSFGALQWFDNAAMQAGIEPPLAFVAAVGSLGTGEVRAVAIADSGSGSYLDVQIDRATLAGFGIADDTVLRLGAYSRDPLSTPWIDVSGCTGTIGCLAESTTSDPVAIDADLDGVSYIDEQVLGTDPEDSDSDDDGLSDGDEIALGTTPTDADSDDDGLPDGLESGVTVPDPGTDLGAGHFTADADPATTTDPNDADTDNGGLTDREEDRDGDGAIGPWETDPNDPFDDADTDGDGIADTLDGFGGNPIDDLDSDLDGFDDATEGLVDSDGDGTPDFLDDDSDGDGVLDADEGSGDADGDGIPDRLDTDSDGDGVPDGSEGLDGNGDGVLDGGQGADTDGDGTADWLDPDTDGDGISNEEEGTADTDGDDLPDAVDPDSDGDGLSDLEEGSDDADCDGIPDFRDDDPYDGICDTGQPIPGVDTGLDSDAPAPGVPGDPFTDGAFTGGACNSAPGSAALLPALAVVGLIRRRRRAAAALGLLASAPALGQEVNAQRFTPNEDPSPFLKLEDGHVAPKLSSAFGAWFGYADDPLVYRPATGDEVKVLEQVGTLYLTGSVSLGRLRIGANLPVHLLSSGYGVEGPSGLGDLGVGGELELLEAGPTRFGAWTDLSLPTGNAAEWVGAGAVGFRFGLSGLASAGPVKALINAGVRTGTGRALGDLAVGPALVGGVGAAVAATSRLDLAAELDGELWLKGGGDPGATPLELLGSAGYEVAPGATLELGGGAGLTQGVGAPDYRVVVGLLYAPRMRPAETGDPSPTAPVAAVAAAPSRLVVRATSPNGEPIPNATVRLVGEGEGAQKTGADGILETTVPAGSHEVVVSAVGWAQGKTVVKADAGGSLDVQIVLQPTSEIVVDAEGGRIYLQRKVFFEVDKASLKVESLAVLDRLVEVLVLRPDVTRMRVEGHTDSTGDDQHNLALSQARAESVVAYLVKSGISPDRLEAKGFGESRPLQKGDSPEVLATNRRVEFHILSLAPAPTDAPVPAPE